MTKYSDMDNVSEDSLQDKEDEANVCNRIFLNFTREFRHPSKDHYNYLKVKELFKYLSERKDLQEMKVSGRLDKEENEDDKKDEEEGEEVEEEEEEDEDSKGCGGWESYYDEETTPKRGGQRFAMSRDFWYRKLNTLKAQKLDEAALEARDIPPNFQSKEQRFANWINKTKPLPEEEITASEKPEDVMTEIDRFEKAVAKPVEKKLKTRFINVYENRKYFRSDRCE